jgi:hypothetical protein
MMIRLSFLVGLICLLAGAGTARAACTVDTDCTGNAACGGDICDFYGTVPTCKPAGGHPNGMDGWCNVDTDCKCHAQGATCTSVYCSFTVPDGGTSTGTGGSSGSAGSTGSSGSSGGGGGGCSLAGGMAADGSFALAGLGLVTALARRRRRR